MSNISDEYIIGLDTMIMFNSFAPGSAIWRSSVILILV